MCRPVGVFWAEACPGGHIGPPLRGGEKFPQPTRPSCVEASAMGRDGARPLRGEREWTDGGVWSPRPTGATQVMPSNGPMWASAPTERRESHINHPGQRRTAKRLRRGREGWVEIGAGIIPEVSSNAGQSLSQPAADSSLCTRETFPCGGRGMRITVTGESVFFLQGNGGVRSPRPTKQGGKLPQLPGQRSERGKSRWSNLIFAR